MKTHFEPHNTRRKAFADIITTRVGPNDSVYDITVHVDRDDIPNFAQTDQHCHVIGIDGGSVIVGDCYIESVSVVGESHMIYDKCVLIRVSGDDLTVCSTLNDNRKVTK